jgi:hypothetical protein
MLNLLQKWDDQKNLDEIQSNLRFFAEDNCGPPGNVGGAIFFKMKISCMARLIMRYVSHFFRP